MTLNTYSDLTGFEQALFGKPGFDEELLEREDLSPEEKQQTEEWRIQSIKEADRVARRIKHILADFYQLEELCVEELEIIQAQLDKAKRAKDGKIRYYEKKLGQFAAEQLKGTKQKGLDLPSGRIQSRTTAQGIDVYDEEGAITGIEKLSEDKQEQFLKIKKSVKKADLKKEWLGHFLEIISRLGGETAENITKAQSMMNEIFPGISYKKAEIAWSFKEKK